MEYDCHIFSKYLVFQMKNSILIEIPWISIEILGISNEAPSLSKKVWNPGFSVDFMYAL